MKKVEKVAPLIAEPYPESYAGYQFLTLIRYQEENYVCIVDNMIEGEIVAYVLDLCSKEFESNHQKQMEEAAILVAAEWFESSKDRHPISIAYSRKGMQSAMTRIVRRFPVEYVSRVIGPMPKYDMGSPTKVKRRKKKPIPKGIGFVNLTQFDG